MSLTSLIRHNSMVRQVLKEICPSKTDFFTNSEYAAFSNKCPIVVPPTYETPLQATLIGTASDYLFRFQVARVIADSKEDVIKNTAAEFGLNHLIKESNDSLKKKYQSIFNNDISIVRHYIFGDSIDIKALAEISLRLANFEYIYRNGKPQDNFEEDLEKTDEKTVRDLINLANQFELNYISSGIVRSNSDVVFNPSFGKWGSRCGGADADIYIDGVLYDFKCTKEMYKDWYEIGQVYGYYCLYLLSSSDTQDDESPCIKKPIHTIAIYKSRYGIINSCILKNSSANYSPEALSKLKSAIEYESSRELNNALKALKTAFDKLPGSNTIHTTICHPRNPPLNSFVYDIGTRIYGGRLIGKGTITSLYQTEGGGLFEIKFDNGQIIKDGLISIFKHEFWIILEQQEIKEGVTVLDLDKGVGTVKRILPGTAFSEIVVDFKNIGERTLNLQHYETVVVQRATPVFKSTDDFPYKKGNVVLYKNEPVIITEVEIQSNDGFVFFKALNGEIARLSLSQALISLEDEYLRNDVSLIHSLNGKRAFVDYNMRVGDTIQFTTKTKKYPHQNIQIETMEGTVIDIHRNEKGINFATIDFGDKGIKEFAGSRLYAFKNPKLGD